MEGQARAATKGACKVETSKGDEERTLEGETMARAATQQERVVSGLPNDWPLQLRKLMLKRYGAWIRSLGMEFMDVYQDVALRILIAQQESPYDPNKARLSTWMLWAARNTIINRLAKKRHPESRCTEEHLEDLAGTEELDEDLSPDFMVHLESNETTVWDRIAVVEAKAVLSGDMQAAQSPTLKEHVKRYLEGR